MNIKVESAGNAQYDDVYAESYADYVCSVFVRLG